MVAAHAADPARSSMAAVTITSTVRLMHLLLLLR
jgi:hypothetical protein